MCNVSDLSEVNTADLHVCGIGLLFSGSYNIPHLLYSQDADFTSAVLQLLTLLPEEVSKLLHRCSKIYGLKMANNIHRCSKYE